MAAAALALREQSRWYWDLLAIGLFVGSLLTVESGVLVWVICVAACALGARGVSRRAVLAMTACLLAYLVARTFVLDVGTPTLAERASGFGFRILEPSDLMARFEGRAWPFYVYNVLSSISTVLFSEPKGGVWRFVYELTTGTIHPWSAVSVASSSAATTLVAWFVWRRRDRIRTRVFDDNDRLVGLFLVVLVANAVISFSYTKNIIMSPAGVFLGLAVSVAAREWFRDAAVLRARAPRRPDARYSSPCSPAGGPIALPAITTTSAGRPPSSVRHGCRWTHGSIGSVSRCEARTARRCATP